MCCQGISGFGFCQEAGDLLGEVLGAGAGQSGGGDDAQVAAAEPDELGEDAQGLPIRPGATGKGKTGRVNASEPLMMRSSVTIPALIGRAQGDENADYELPREVAARVGGDRDDLRLDLVSIVSVFTYFGNDERYLGEQAVGRHRMLDRELGRAAQLYDSERFEDLLLDAFDVDPQEHILRCGLPARRPARRAAPTSSSSSSCAYKKI